MSSDQLKPGLHVLRQQVSSTPSATAATELDLLVRRKKARIGCSVVCFAVVEVAICLFSIDMLHRGEGGGGGKAVLALDREGESGRRGGGGSGGAGDDEDAAADDEIDSGVIEVVLFAIPFMLATDVLVLAAIARDNVWLLLPWMVLHCIVIAFLALGAAILTAHDRYVLGTVSLLGAVFFLLCWKGLRQLFMKMVDRHVVSLAED